MKTIIFITILLGSCFQSYGQSSDSTLLIRLNQQIDEDVVNVNIAALENSYASDFVFNHGSGRIEGKAGWMKTVVKGNYILRQHDSVKVELHPEIAVVRGKMSIQKKNKDTVDKYYLRYIRIFAWREKQWWLVSHITTYEEHEK